MFQVLTRRAALVPCLTMWVVLGAAGCGDTGSTTSSSASSAPKSSSTVAPEESTDSTEAPETSAKTATVPDPCKLVPLEAAQAVLPGATLLPGETLGKGTDLGCQYAGDPNGPTAQVEIYVGDGAKKSYDIDATALGHEFVELPGIGDEAHYEDGNVFFRNGTVWVQIRAVTLEVDPAVVKTNLTALATEAAGRM